MKSVKELLEQLKEKTSFTYGGGNYEEYEYTPEEHAAILSLLSQSTGSSGQSEGAPIKLSAGSHGGDRFLTQQAFNRMYAHYSDLCDKEDTNSWWENQFYMLKAQQQGREYSEEDMLSFCEWVANERWREDFLEQRTLTTKDLLGIYNNLPK